MLIEKKSQNDEDLITIIEPNSEWKILDFKELKEYRDLFFFLVWRDIKVQYAQTIMGFSWAIIQPLIQITLFTVVFGKVAKLPSDGIPYPLFLCVAIIPWTYVAASMAQSSQSLIQGSNMLGKIYFPRLLFPITPVLSRLVGFVISIVIVFGILLFYQISPTWNLLFLPLFLILMVSVPLGGGLWLSSLAIRFRDVKHALPFFIQMLMYSAPIVYSASSIPETYRILYSLNPIVGVTEGFRACLLGTPIPWIYIFPGILTSAILLLSGALYFNRMERVIADVI